MTTSTHSSFLHRLDILSSVQIIKVNRNNSYQTKCGGFMTIAFGAIIMVILAFRIKSRIDGQLMTFTSKQVYDSGSLRLKQLQDENNSFMRIRIYNDRGQHSLNYFQVRLTIRSYINYIQYPRISYLFQPCKNQTKQGRNWTNMDFCSPVLKNFSLFGHFQSLEQTFLDVNIQPCVDNKFNCADYSQIASQTFWADIFYYNNILNMDQIDYKQRTFNKIYTYFNYYTSAQAIIQYSKYKIKTDRSYLSPITQSQQIQQQGYYLQQKPSVDQTIYDPNVGFTIIRFMRSTKTRVVQRRDHGVVDILSYIGGLSTAILAIIQFIVNIYNQYSFEKQFIQKIFYSNQSKDSQSSHFNKQNQKKKQQNKAYNSESKVLQFCNWMKEKLFCCCSNPWAYAYKQQLIKQLDIEIILKKNNIFQNVLLKLVATTQLGQQMTEIKKYDIQKAKKFRQVFDVFEKSEVESEHIQNQGKQNDNVEKLDTYYEKNTNINQEKEYKGPLQINLQLNYQSNQQIYQKEQNYQQKVNNNFKNQSLNMNDNIKSQVINDNLLQTNKCFVKNQVQINSISSKKKPQKRSNNYNMRNQNNQKNDSIKEGQ